MSGLDWHPQNRNLMPSTRSRGYMPPTVYPETSPETPQNIPYQPQTAWGWIGRFLMAIMGGCVKGGVAIYQHQRSVEKRVYFAQEDARVREHDLAMRRLELENERYRLRIEALTNRRSHDAKRQSAQMRHTLAEILRGGQQ